MMQWLKDNETVIINSDGKTVTVLCTLNSSDAVYNCMYGTKFYNNYGRYFCETSQDTLTFIGVARYKDGDDYNVTLATRVAESKMERQFHKFLIKHLKNDIHTISRCLNNLNRLLEKEENASETVTSHIKDILE